MTRLDFLALAVMCLASGAALAWAATRRPGQAAALECCGGLLLVAGLGLLGVALPSPS